MGKKSVIACFIFFLCIQIKAQIANSNLSVSTMMWLCHHPQEQFEKGGTNKTGNYLGALIKVSENFDESSLFKAGVVIGTKLGDIWTVRVPSDKMRDVVKINGIEFIDLDTKVSIKTDSARYVTRVDSVHSGTNLPMALSGKGVVVGVLDWGFDFTHPAYYDTSYQRLRIAKVWDQRTNGTPPLGYNYGTELKDTNSILARKFSENFQDHGTCTSTIAMGSGYGSNKLQYKGIAYEADAVLVETNADTTETGTTTYSTMIDGMRYMFDYAKSVNKPAVINVSIGGADGPHDGTSLFSQAINNLTGPGKIIVFAAGNEGSSNTHLYKSFTPSDSSLSTIVEAGSGNAYFEIWGDTGKSYCIELGLYSNGVKGQKTNTLCVDNSWRQLELKGSDNDSVIITVVSRINPFNHKPQYAIRIKKITKDSVYITVKGKDGAVHMWTETIFQGNGNWAVQGDGEFTVGEYSCAKWCISVGAYASKVTWKNLQNQNLTLDTGYVRTLGDKALFSSIGPAADGMMKPNITAPGALICTATNSYSPTYRSGGGYYFFTVSSYLSPRTHRTYFYSGTIGTSVAAPVVTGIVALMLQVNPGLTPDMVLKTLYKTALKDSFTTATPDPKLWGAGKINAYGAIKATILTAGTITIPDNEKVFDLYPNPGNGKFTLTYQAPQEGYFLIELSNALGQNISTNSWHLMEGLNQKEIELTGNPKGVYFLQITGRGGQLTKKLILN